MKFAAEHCPQGDGIGEPQPGSGAISTRARAGELAGSADSGLALRPGDFYFDRGLVVFSKAYHVRRGYCCGNGCRHCPYPIVE